MFFHLLERVAPWQGLNFRIVVIVAYRSGPNKADKGGLKSLDNRAKLILQWMPLKEKLESFFLLQLNGLEVDMYSVIKSLRLLWQEYAN